jgi:lipoprotein-anchoring transpeptidase ErfK/SrfK
MKALFLILPLGFLLPSCTPTDSGGGGGSDGYLTAFRSAPPTGERRPMAHEKGYWDGDAEAGPSSIRIVRDEQKAYFYKGNQVVGMSPIATGKSTHTTPAGSFKITQKNTDHKSSLYGVIRDTTTGQIVNDDADTRKHRAGPGEVFENAPMPYFMRFNGGIGMHVGHLPGYAASHGCVRMPQEMAVKYFENVEVGTPVIVE